MSAFLICLTLFMLCLIISEFRSEWKHIPFYEKMSPSKSQLVKLISILSQIILDSSFEILIWKCKPPTYLHSVELVCEPCSWFCVMRESDFMPDKWSLCLQLKRELTGAPGRGWNRAEEPFSVRWEKVSAQQWDQAAPPYPGAHFTVGYCLSKCSSRSKADPGGKQIKLLCIFQIVRSSSDLLNYRKNFYQIWNSPNMKYITWQWNYNWYLELTSFSLLLSLQNKAAKSCKLLFLLYILSEILAKLRTKTTDIKGAAGVSMRAQL